MVSGGNYPDPNTPPPNYSAFDGQKLPLQPSAPIHHQQTPSGSGHNTKGSKNATKKNTGLLSSIGMGRQPGVEDVYIAVMGVTGAGKSSFIELCTGKEIKIGHNLKSCTVLIEDFTFMYDDKLRVHLIDTPGFDDTDRKDTEVLRDIAGWLGVTYDKNIKLSGLIYLHRITDVRMTGSAKRNLFMFQKLCGPDCLPNVILATTMWGNVEPNLGTMREKELVETEDFWGYMRKSGSTVLRHMGTRKSAMQILERLLKRRHEMTLAIQQEINIEGRDLDDTGAGRQVNEDILKERAMHQREMRELETDMREAMDAKNHEAEEQIRQLQRDLQEKIDQGERDRQTLQTDLERLQADREQEIKRIQEQLEAQAELYAQKSREFDELRQSQSGYSADMEERNEEIKRMREELKASLEELDRKKTGVWSKVGDWIEDKVSTIAEWTAKVATYQAVQVLFNAL